MATRLVQVISFTNVGPSATQTLPHNININDVPQAPDFVAADASGFSVAVTAAQVSVTNNGAAPASVNVWLELKHSIARELGRPFGDPFASLTPRPFIAASGSAGGGGSSSNGTYIEDFVGDGAIFKTLVAGGTANPFDVGSLTGSTQDAIGLLLLEAANPGDQVSVAVGKDVEQFSWSRDGVNPQSFSVTWRAEFLQGNPPPTAIADYNVELGFDQLAAISPVPPNHGAAFVSGFGRFGNANWWASFDGNAFTADTGIAIDADVWHIFKIDVQATPSGGQILTWFIDGAQVAQLAFVSPFGGNFMQIAGISALSGAVDLLVDYVKLDIPGMSRGL